jgi:hypothetical protein
MAFVLVNSDNTINFIGEELEDWLCLDGVTIEEIPGKTVEEIMGDVPNVHCVWDTVHRVVRDDRKFPELLKLGTNESQSEPEVAV